MECFIKTSPLAASLLLSLPILSTLTVYFSFVTESDELCSYLKNASTSTSLSVSFFSQIKENHRELQKQQRVFRRETLFRRRQARVWDLCPARAFWSSVGGRPLGARPRTGSYALQEHAADRRFLLYISCCCANGRVFPVHGHCNCGRCSIGFLGDVRGMLLFRAQ